MSTSRNTITAVTAALLIALCAAAPAGAYTSGQLAQWNAVADQVWGGACAGRHVAVIVDTLPSQPGSQFVRLGQAYINDATTCRYWLVRGLTDYQACVVVVHEAGHLAGFDHTQGGIMDAHPTEVFTDGSYPPCAAIASPTLTIDAAANWVEHSRWGRYMKSLDCRRDRIQSRQRCWGTTAGRRHLRFTVWMRGDYQIRGGKWK